MKILLVSSSSGSRGGGELYLIYLGRALSRLGSEVALWASSHPRMDELSNTFSGFGEVFRSGYRNTYDRLGRSVSTSISLAGTRRIVSEWKKLGPDCIHLNKQNLEDGLDLLDAADHAGIPNIATIHLTQSATYLNARFAAARDFVSRRRLRRYGGDLVTVLESRKRDLIRFIGHDRRIHVVPNGVPLFDLTGRDHLRTSKRAELGLADDDFAIMAVGRLVPQKRPLLFLEMAEKIRQLVPNAKFTWVGEGSLNEEWDARVAAHGTAGFIQRVPWQPDVQPYLFAADLFLHVADFEGLPLALLEGMSAGLPCVITENLVREMPFVTPANAITATPDDGWIGQLMNRQNLARIGLEARELVKTQFSHERMAHGYEAIYQSAISRGG